MYALERVRETDRQTDRPRPMMDGWVTSSTSPMLMELVSDFTSPGNVICFSWVC